MQEMSTSEMHASLWFRGARQAGFILLVALIPSLLAVWFHPRRPAWSRNLVPVPEIDWTAAKKLGSDVVLIDARSSEAFEAGHIPGALRLGSSPEDDGTVAVARAWKPGKKLVVYCDSARCDAAQAAARRLRQELGIEDIAVLKGGWSSWSHAHKQGR
jgi:rhodanese-related sulfurtransferase